MPRLKRLKHEIFAQSLADGTDYLQAYEICMGGKPGVPSAAGRLARRPDVRDRVAEIIRARVYQGGEISQTRVMTELARIAFSDIRKVARWKTREELVALPSNSKVPSSSQPMATKRVTELMLLDSDKIDDDTAAAIQSITRGKDGSLQVKFHDKRTALRDIGQQLGMFVERTEIGGPGDFSKLNDEELERFIRAKVVSLGPMVDGEATEAPTEAQEGPSDDPVGLGGADTSLPSESD